LTVLGLGLGLAIRGSTTMVPAHYHASVGAVTVAFMAATYALLGAFGLSLPGPRWRRALAWQPVLYGAGMGLLAAGFALAGSRGMGRKLYGAEQAARTLAESAGLAVMGVGGFVAVAGGVLFLVVVGAALGRGAHARFSSGLAASPRR
jgi:heme/copper-type cytochrome/quinol oxidase subunit 1